MINTPKMETSKKILWISVIVSILLSTIVLICTFTRIECSNITTITTLAWGELSAYSAFYLTMNKRLNVPKIIMGIYNDLPDNLKEQVDINQLINNLLD